MDLAQKVRELAGIKSRIVHMPLPPDDPQRRCPDISRAMKLLGWAPSVTPEEGLNKTIEWFGQRRKATRCVCPESAFSYKSSDACHTLPVRAILGWIGFSCFTRV